MSTRIRSDAVTEIEWPWMVLVDQRGIVVVRDELAARGLPQAQAATLAFWLSDQLERRRHASPRAVASYRRILEELQPPANLRTIPGYREPARSAA